MLLLEAEILPGSNLVFLLICSFSPEPFHLFKTSRRQALRLKQVENTIQKEGGGRGLPKKEKERKNKTKPRQSLVPELLGFCKSVAHIRVVTEGMQKVHGWLCRNTGS